MRMLMMFGPMIYRQFQKYQRNKAREESVQNTQNPDRQHDGEHQSGRR